MERLPSRRTFIALGAICCALMACAFLFPAPATPTVPALPATTVMLQPSPLVVPSEISTATQSVTETPTITPTLDATSTASGPLTGTVTQKSNCRYGPGAYYLYKVGYKVGAKIQVIGRDADGNWIQVQGAKCWINAEQVQVDGDIKTAPDTYRDSTSLPKTNDYGPTTITGVSGSGGSVTVDWTAVVLPDYAMVSDIEREYVIEVWTCQNGAPAFYSLGTNDTSMTFDVDDSCGEASRADVVVQIKTGVWVTPITLP